mmetsp:Transcript_7812/g.21433  ORF Transcript_7812/g.21433 Transcript_7812/m.21433 type:complete len:574 (-) Transcript_7812:96-1817(-)
MRGFDHLVSLNFVRPRSFLLQVEDDLDRFIFGQCQACVEDSADTGGANAAVQHLQFPPLARSFEELLCKAAGRYGLTTAVHHDRRQRRRMRVALRCGTSANVPSLSYVDFLRPQRKQTPPPDSDPMGSSREHRLRLRHWALTWMSQHETSGEAPLLAELQQVVDLAFSSQSGARRVESSAESDGYKPSSSSGTLKRGRGFDVQTQDPVSKPRHCYRRFGPDAARRIYLRDDFARAPWPSVKMQRVSDEPEPPIVWRPEWQVGPEEGDASEDADMGGLMSWAVEASEFGLDEGFEVVLRECSDEAENPEREEDDFVLMFRRGQAEWRFVAGSRARLEKLPVKIIKDEEGASRRMFWAACLESRTDEKHYVIAGTVPGLLAEHFFVARVKRNAPLTRAGFAYLPSKQGTSKESAPALIESISIYPHALTGELPFVSLRFVEQRAANDADNNVLVAVPLPARCRADGNGEAVDFLCVRGIPIPGQDPARLEGVALQEVGLQPPAQSEEEKLAKRARRRVEVPLLDSTIGTPVSWEPCAVQPKFGAYDDVLRHDPSAWDVDGNIKPNSRCDGSDQCS